MHTDYLVIYFEMNFVWLFMYNVAMNLFTSVVVHHITNNKIDFSRNSH